MARGMTDQKYYKEIADMLRSDLGAGYENATFKPKDMAKAVDDVYVNSYGKGLGEGYNTGYNGGYKAGQKEEYDRFWDNYKVTSGLCSFAGYGWNNETFKPKYDINPTSAYMMFRNSMIEGDLVEILEKQGIVLDFSASYSLQYTFQNTKFTRVGEIMAVANFVDTFQNSALLERIDLITVTSKLTYSTNTFAGCTALKNISFSGTIGNTINFEDCPLTAESLVSVVEHLSSTATGKTATFKQTAIDNADWTATNYASWDELCATKSNWTFDCA